MGRITAYVGAIVVSVVVPLFVAFNGNVDTNSGIIENIIDGSNYAEGPHPIRDKDGSVYIYHHQGNCCYSPAPNSPGWEGILVTGSGGTRVVYLNDYSNDEWEIAYPSVAYWDGEMRIAFVRTNASTMGEQNRARISFGWLYNVSSVAHVEHGAIVPIERECSRIGTCYGAGVMYPSLVVMPGGELLLWVVDDARPTEEYRRRVYGYRAADEYSFDTTPIIPMFRDENGRVVYPKVTDVGLGSDGRLYALSSEWLWSGIVEWYSEQTPTRKLGEVWRPTGRTYLSDNLSVWDGAYLKDRKGKIEEPRIVVGVSSPPGAPASSGTWRLWWYAEPGANIPEWWGSVAPTPTPTASPTPTPTQPPTPTPTPRIPRKIVPPYIPTNPYTIMVWTFAKNTPHRITAICGPSTCWIYCNGNEVHGNRMEQVFYHDVPQAEDTKCSVWGAIYAVAERTDTNTVIGPPKIIISQPPE